MYCFLRCELIRLILKNRNNVTYMVEIQLKEFQFNTLKRRSFPHFSEPSFVKWIHFDMVTYIFFVCIKVSWRCTLKKNTCECKAQTKSQNKLLYTEKASSFAQSQSTRSRSRSEMSLSLRHADGDAVGNRQPGERRRPLRDPGHVHGRRWNVHRGVWRTVTTHRQHDLWGKGHEGASFTVQLQVGYWPGELPLVSCLFFCFYYFIFCFG